MTGIGERPPSLAAAASPERVAAVLAVALVIGVGAVVLSGGSGIAAPTGSPTSSDRSTAPSSRPSASAPHDVDEASVRAILTLNERLGSIADELERELSADRPAVSRLAASLRQANVAVVAGAPTIDRLASDPPTATLGSDLAVAYSLVRERASSTLSNSLVNDAAYVEGSRAVVASIRALGPISENLRSLLGDTPSPSP
jgi:hypothetical protein